MFSSFRNGMFVSIFSESYSFSHGRLRSFFTQVHFLRSLEEWRWGIDIINRTGIINLSNNKGIILATCFQHIGLNRILIFLVILNNIVTDSYIQFSSNFILYSSDMQSSSTNRTFIREFGSSEHVEFCFFSTASGTVKLNIRIDNSLEIFISSNFSITFNRRGIWFYKPRSLICRANDSFDLRVF